MSQPWLSVIVPTYNGAAFLDQALRSVASQANDGVEVIAVDDGSTDETPAILKRYAGPLQLRVENRGRIGNWAANSNHGLQLARAPRVCFLHQDDLWLPGRLLSLWPLLDRAGDATLVLHPSFFVDGGGRILGRWHCPLSAGLHAPPQVVERLLVQNFIAIPAPVFSRQAALDVGGLDENLWYTADWDFWLRLAARGPTVYLAKPLTAFRVHANSQTMRGTSRAAEMRRQLEVVVDRHLAPWRRSREVAAAARLSIEVNHALAHASAGGRPDWWGLVRRFAAAGPSGCLRFLRDSRIVERVGARAWARWHGLTSVSGAGADSA
jgi:glycosyltransferase involved in cell wall biosynthesis